MYFEKQSHYPAQVSSNHFCFTKKEKRYMQLLSQTLFTKSFKEYHTRVKSLHSVHRLTASQ